MSYRESHAALASYRKQIEELRAKMREIQAAVEPEPVADYRFATADGPKQLADLFGGKDDLVRTYLQNRHAKWAARIDDELAAAATPTDKILAVFDALGDLFAQPDFRGCAFINAAAEAPAGSAEERATRDFRTWLHELFAALVTAAGYRDPGQLTTQLVILYDGANISAQMDHNPAAAAAVRDAAASLLSAAAR